MPLKIMKASVARSYRIIHSVMDDHRGKLPRKEENVYKGIFPNRYAFFIQIGTSALAVVQYDSANCRI